MRVEPIAVEVIARSDSSGSAATIFAANSAEAGPESGTKAEPAKITPIAVWDAITADPTLSGYGFTAATVVEAQSLDVDTRPGVDGHNLIIDLMEQATVFGGRHLGPRVLDIVVHVPAELTRDYRIINRILNRIDAVLAELEQVIGRDGVRVTQIRPMDRREICSIPVGEPSPQPRSIRCFSHRHK